MLSVLAVDIEVVAASAADGVASALSVTALVAAAAAAVAESFADLVSGIFSCVLEMICI